MGVIYKITSPSGKFYVGKTYHICNRIKSHKSSARTGKKSLLNNSIRKYGWDLHKFEIIETIDDTKLNEREIFWIKELCAYYHENKMGLNLTRGGDGQRHSWKHDEERVKQAKKRCGVNAPNFGKKIPDDVKKKIAESTKIYNLKTNKTVPRWAVIKSIEKRQKAIICYDRYGHFVSEFNSIKEASVHFDLDRKSVNDAVNGIQKHSG